MTQAMNPKTVAALERAFNLGAAGHCIHPPLARDREPALRRWLDFHHGEIFFDEDNRIVGVYGCTCDACWPLIGEFVCSEFVSLRAQSAGDWTFRRVSADKASAEECLISPKDKNLVEIASTVAARVAEDVSVKAARTVAQGFLEEQSGQS